MIFFANDIPPNIRHHRVPAPDLSFTRPNLPFLIAEVERSLLKLERGDRPE